MPTTIAAATSDMPPPAGEPITAQEPWPPLVQTKPEAPHHAARPSAREAAKDAGRAHAREARDRATGGAAQAPASGIIQLAISPWGQVEVDGTPVGTVPPLTELALSAGTHRVVVRNADYPPYSTSVEVRPGMPVLVKHRFGS